MSEYDAASGAAETVARRRVVRAGHVAITVFAVTTSVLSSVTFLALDSTVPGTDESSFTVRGTLGFFAALGAATALVWRHKRPLLVTVIAAVPPIVLVTDSLAALIALAALAASRRDHLLWAGTALVLMATTATTAYDAARYPQESLVQNFFVAPDATERADIHPLVILILAMVTTAIPLSFGLWRGTRRDLARRYEQERQLRTDLARQDERSKIARDMHDVLGHRLSRLSLQAGALEVTRDTTDDVADAAKAIRTTARESLDDLRQVIGVLRDEQASNRPDDTQVSAPVAQPTLADLPELIDATRASGLNINLTMLIDGVMDAPDAMGTAAYRIVQESLTNVLRHAPGESADVTVRGAPHHGVTIEVVNPLVNAAPPTGGTGLLGIQERASALGGRASAGPDSDGKFTVTAWLPWPTTS